MPCTAIDHLIINSPYEPGGSKETHEQMQEKAIKFNEKLRRRGKTLEEIDYKEFKEIAREVGMTCPEEKKK